MSGLRTSEPLYSRLKWLLKVSPISAPSGSQAVVCDEWVRGSCCAAEEGDAGVLGRCVS